MQKQLYGLSYSGGSLYSGGYSNGPSIGFIYRQEHRRMQAEVMDLAERAERKGFPLLAAEILAFGVVIEQNTAPDKRLEQFGPRIADLNAALREVDHAWRSAEKLVKPSVFEAAYLVD